MNASLGQPMHRSWSNVSINSRDTGINRLPIVRPVQVQYGYSRGHSRFFRLRPRKAIAVNSRRLAVKSSTVLKASIVATWVLAFSGCTDLKPIQAQIDDLKSQVSKLQIDTAKSESDAQAAMSAAQSASSAASSAQSTANQALTTAQQNSAAVDAINEKIDRMFKRSVSK